MAIAKAEALCWRMRSGSVTEPRLISQALNGEMMPPKFTCAVKRIWSVRALVVAIEPPSASP